MPREVVNYYREMASRYDYRQDHASAGTGKAKGHGKAVDFTGVQQFYRLFHVPRLGHCCFSGSGPFEALVDWVENGVAPEQIDGMVGSRSVRICPYPHTAIYIGDNSDDPESYICGGELGTPDSVCNDVLVKYKHEADGPLDYTGTGVNRRLCSDTGN